MAALLLAFILWTLATGKAEDWLSIIWTFKGE